MRTSSFTALVLLIVLIGIAVATWRPWAPSAPSAPADSASSIPLVGSGPQAQGNLAVGSEADVAANLASARQSAVAAAGEAGEQAVAKRRLVIQVYDRKRGVPAIGATVFLVADVDGDAGGGGGADWSATRGPFGRHWSSIAERSGQSYRTNELGRVEVPDVAGSAILAAQLPGAYAYRWIDAEEGDDGNLEKPEWQRVTTLVLRDDLTLRVRVVDANGAPVAGVAVGVVERFPNGSSVAGVAKQLADTSGTLREIQRWMESNPATAAKGQQKLDAVVADRDRLRLQLAELNSRAQAAAPVEAKRESRMRSETDALGVAEFSHLQIYCKRKQESRRRKNAKKGAGDGGAEGTEREYEAALLVPMTRPVVHSFSLAKPPIEPIELELPETARLTLRTVDCDGRPFLQPVHGQLSMSFPAGAAPVDPELRAWSRLMLRKGHGEAAITFPHVGLGLLLRARCRLDDNDFQWRSPEFFGPVAAGESVRVDLVVAPDAGMLHGRLVSQEGLPLAETTHTFLINAESGRLEGEEVTTSADGRFHLPYHVEDTQLPPYRLEVRRRDPKVKGSVAFVGASIPLQSLPTATVVDLGDLTLLPLEAFVRGVVVDDMGEPIAGAEIQLQRERQQGASRELRFVDEAFVETESRADGSFELYGQFESGRFRLHVDADDHLHSNVAVVDPGRLCRVELTRRCRLLGTLEVPEWLDLKSVLVELSPVAVDMPGGQAATPRAMRPRNDRLRENQGKTVAYFDWLRPGTYDLSFRLRAHPEPFLKLDRLRLLPGQVDAHERLAGLNLGAHIFRFEVHAVDEAGQPVDLNRPQIARLSRADGSQQYLGLVLKGRQGEVVHTEQQLEVFPMCAGYTASPQVLSPGRSELRFRRVPPVDIVLPGLSALTANHAVRVQVVLERRNLGGLPAELQSFDRMSGRIADWYAGARFTTAPLGAAASERQDCARLQVTASGEHRVLVRLGKGASDTVLMGTVDIQLASAATAAQPERHVVSIDTALLQRALASIATRGRNASGR